VGFKIIVTSWLVGAESVAVRLATPPASIMLVLSKEKLAVGLSSDDN